jgi:hypothetical protein
VFGGTLRSDLICSACGHVSTSHEQFSHLSLDIPPPQQLIAPTILPRPTGGHGGGGGGGSSQPHAAAAAQAAPAAAGGGGHGSQAGGAIKAKSHKKGASSSGRAATNQSGGASKGSRLVGAAKLSHERALARKAAETAAAAAAAAMEAAAAPVAGSGGSDSPVELFNTQHSNVQQWQSQGQQQLGGLEGPQPLGQGGDSSSEVEIIDMCASDSSECLLLLLALCADAHLPHIAAFDRLHSLIAAFITSMFLLSFCCELSPAAHLCPFVSPLLTLSSACPVCPVCCLCSEPGRLSGQWPSGAGRPGGCLRGAPAWAGAAGG